MNVRPAYALAGLVVLVFCGTTVAQDDPTEEIPSLTLQWTTLARQRNQLESSWRDQQPVLEQQLSLLNREKQELSDFLEQNATAQDEVEEHRLELLQRQSELEQQQATLELELDAAAIQIRNLYRQLPPPMVAAWDERLPNLQADFLTTSERLQAMLEMLGELDDFDRKVSLDEEVMTLADGQEHLVREIYLGLAQGWYVSSNGSFAGIGRPGANGWQWQPSDEDAVTVDRIIAILERRRTAELVTVPVEIGDSQPR